MLLLPPADDLLDGDGLDMPPEVLVILPPTLLPAALLRALADYHPSRAIEAVAHSGHPSDGLPATTWTHLAQWIHDGAEVVEIGAEAIKVLLTLAPRIMDACAQEQRVIGITITGLSGLLLVRPVTTGIDVGIWNVAMDGRPVSTDIERIDPLSVAIGSHGLSDAPHLLAAVTSGLCAARQTRLLPAAEPPTRRRAGRRGGALRVRRLLLDLSALSSWVRPVTRQERAASTAPSGPATPRGIHHVAEHTRRVWVSDPAAGEEVLGLREGRRGPLALVRRRVEPHVRGSDRLLVRRARLVTGPEDLRA